MGKDGTLVVTKVFWLIGFLIDFVSIVEIKNIKKVWFFNKSLPLCENFGSHCLFKVLQLEKKKITTDVQFLYLLYLISRSQKWKMKWVLFGV